jgi:hypothetical protein
MIQADEKLINVQFEHLIWHNELQNYLIEIEIYDDRIQSLLALHQDDDLQQELRTFRDKFHELKTNINHWKVSIGQHEYRIMEVAKLDGAIKLLTNSEHSEIRKKVQLLRKSMMKIKEKFQYFLLKRI